MTIQHFRDSEYKPYLELVWNLCSITTVVGSLSTLAKIHSYHGLDTLYGYATKPISLRHIKVNTYYQLVDGSSRIVECKSTLKSGNVRFIASTSFDGNSSPRAPFQIKPEYGHSCSVHTSRTCDFIMPLPYLFPPLTESLNIFRVSHEVSRFIAVSSFISFYTCK